MKKYMKSLKKIMVIFALGAVFSACEKYTEGVSEFDPTQPTDASLGQVVNSGEVAYIGFMEGELARIAGMWSSQFTGADRQYVALNNYTSTAPDYDNAWGNIYAGVLKALRIAQEKATTANNKRALALAQILEAHAMVTTASVFGDIPYSQANDLADFPNPAFDKQLDVYNATLSLLNTALANISAAAAGTTYEGDFFYGGGGAASDAYWKAAANTTKAKIYLHLGQYGNAITAAQAGITDPSGDLIAPHGTIYLSDFNIFYSFMVYDRPGYLGAADALAPRLLDSTADEYRGNAKTNEDDRFAYSYITDENYVAGYEPNYYSEYDWGAPDGYFGTNTGWAIVTYRENQLILAEATLRTNGDALSLLNDYRAYLDGGGYLNPDYYSGPGNYLPLLPTDFIAGGIENPDGISANDALYREIIQEKYISLLGTIEVFNDMRRKGFGSFAGKQNWQVVGITPNTGSEIPQRFIISQAEINSNTSAPTPTPGLFDKTAVFN